jgi:hypothetical protein
MRNAVCIGSSSILSGYALDVTGNIITTGNIALVNASRSIFWTGTNSNLGRAGAAGEYSISAAINDIVLRSSNKLILQSGVGEGAIVVNGFNNVGIRNSAPTAPLSVGNSNLSSSNGFITIGKNDGLGGARSQYIGYNSAFDLVIGDYGGGGTGPLIEAFKLSYAAPVNSLVVNSGGNISMPNTVSIGTDRWHSSTEGAARVYYSPNNTTYLRGHGGTSFVFRNGSDGDIANITSGGNLSVSGFLYAPSYIYTNGFLQGNGSGGAFRILRPDNWVRLRDPGETTHLDFAAGRLYAHNQLDVQGQATFNALTIFNQYTVVYNTLQVRLTNISSTNTDYVCVAGNTGFNSVNDKALYIANGTFTGFHRNYSDDELFDPETPELFKNNFAGCIVISTGKIKTDYSTIEEEINENNEINNKVEWKSAIDKEGIFIE